MSELIELIEAIPQILQYFIPGAWSLILFSFGTSKRFSSKYFLSLSCVLSYILLSFVQFLRLVLHFDVLPKDVLIDSGICVLIGTFVSILLSFFMKRDFFRKITHFLFFKTINDSIWDDIVDFEHGSSVKIYPKGKDYFIIGGLGNFEDKGNDPWISVTGFQKFDIETNENYKYEPEYIDNEDVILAMRFSDIDHIVIFNNIQKYEENAQEET